MRRKQALQKLINPVLRISSSAIIRLDGKNVSKLRVRTGYRTKRPSGGVIPLNKHRLVTLMVRWPPAESPANTNFVMSIPSYSFAWVKIQT